MTCSLQLTLISQDGNGGDHLANMKNKYLFIYVFCSGDPTVKNMTWLMNFSLLNSTQKCNVSEMPKILAPSLVSVIFWLTR